MVLATLDIDPAFALTREHRVNVIESDWRHGIHQVEQVSPYEVRTWTVRIPNDPGGTERAKVQAQWDASKGPAGVFEWTPPGGSAVAVRFVADSFQPVQRNGAMHGFEIQLEEALNHDG